MIKYGLYYSLPRKEKTYSVFSTGSLFALYWHTGFIKNKIFLKTSSVPKFTKLNSFDHFINKKCQINIIHLQKDDIEIKRMVTLKY